MLARYSRSLKIQKAHFFIGFAISLLFTSLVASQGFNLWVWQADMVSQFLYFGGVSHTIFILGSPTFEMIIDSNPIPFATAIILLGGLTAFILIVSIIRRIPSPVKTISLVASTVALFTLAWQTFVQSIPPNNLHWVTLDWSCSGVIGLCLITLIYVPFLFAIRGPLRVKVLWLCVTAAFSVCWNILRMSMVTSTLYYFGGTVFLTIHYLAGVFIDFVYIVAFYSLALAHLSKYQDGG